MTARSVSRADRARDAIAVAVLALGGSLWLYGYLGLRAAKERPIVVVPGGPSAVEQTVRYWNFTRAGAAIVIVGALVVAWSFWRHHRQQRTA